MLRKNILQRHRVAYARTVNMIISALAQRHARVSINNGIAARQNGGKRRGGSSRINIAGGAKRRRRRLGVARRKIEEIMAAILARRRQRGWRNIWRHLRKYQESGAGGIRQTKASWQPQISGQLNSA